ncbi:DUF2793 domain-containing protein [Brevundimonas aurantiaca]|uniref:DUF2793 domain-containing protein n=1 Tax=Brevundimonas aurantiaca TaxID=74316 RepID=UPI001CD33253|nr:DUF2793 domain-containing protein [Brevundimonas aurantiaca]
MSEDFTARLGLPYLAAGQMQKHVTLNAALSRLDALVQTAVISRSVSKQPATPADGDLYILPQAPVGPAWSGRPAGALMRFEAGGWAEVAAPVGLIALVLDAGVIVVRSAAGWRPLGDCLGEAQGLSRLGWERRRTPQTPWRSRATPPCLRRAARARAATAICA